MNVKRLSFKNVLTFSVLRTWSVKERLFVGFAGIIVLALLTMGGWVMGVDGLNRSAVGRPTNSNEQSKQTHTAGVSATEAVAQQTQTSSIPSTNTEQKPPEPKIKYSTSPDPRSTAYSTTPPGPNQADVNIRITRNGQVTAGTLISYNATKGEKTYYGGDLLFSAAVLTISKGSGVYTAPFTVTIPDGQTAQGPSMPWDDQNYTVFPASSSPLQPGTSWSMFIQASSTTPNGTYKVHLSSNRTAQTADGWVYHGFLTVAIVD